MSQPSVERILGRLVTDEAFRRRFWSDPQALLAELESAGLRLNPCERRALLALHHQPVERFAAALDPCIQKAAWSAASAAEPIEATEPAAHSTDRDA
jgi:hypothetical protein